MISDRLREIICYLLIKTVDYVRATTKNVRPFITASFKNQLGILCEAFLMFSQLSQLQQKFENVNEVLAKQAVWGKTRTHYATNS
jgi:hypothetical protein